MSFTVRGLERQIDTVEGCGAVTVGSVAKAALEKGRSGTRNQAKAEMRQHWDRWKSGKGWIKPFSGSQSRP